MAITQCSDCGGKVSTTAEACPHCGSPVEPHQSQITCLDCGEDFEASLTACPVCGGPVEAHTAPASSKLEVREDYWPNGQLKDRDTYKDGKLHGTTEAYWDNGQLYVMTTHRDGVLNGPSEEHDEEGQLVEKGTYNMGEKCGEWIERGWLGGYKTVNHPPC